MEASYKGHGRVCGGGGGGGLLPTFFDMATIFSGGISIPQASLIRSTTVLVAAEFSPTPKYNHNRASGI
jgi:hypothetical protein